MRWQRTTEGKEKSQERDDKKERKRMTKEEKNAMEN